MTTQRWPVAVVLFVMFSFLPGMLVGIGSRTDVAVAYGRGSIPPGVVVNYNGPTGCSPAEQSACETACRREGPPPSRGVWNWFQAKTDRARVDHPSLPNDPNIHATT